MAKNTQPPQSGFNEFLLYTTPNGKVKVEVYLQNETVWLTQQKIADLFGVDRTVVSKHLKNIFETNELNANSVSAKIAHTASDGKTYAAQFYNLDAIISVGYRVNSTQATAFRIWATERLKEFIIKGFTMDDERLKNPNNIFGKDYFDEQLARIRIIRSSERRFYQKITDIYSNCSADYNVETQATKDFFSTIQNKLHWAITGKTAAELIAARVDRTKDNMGLTTWKNAPKGSIRKTDVSIAKNYLDEKELDALVIPRGIPAGNSTTATDPSISEHATMKWNYDARNEKDQVLEFSTFYNFASCIGDSVYSIVKSTDTTRGQLFYPNLQKAYVRVMANLKRKNGLGQNVLFVAKYPAAIDTLSALSKFKKPAANCDDTVFSAAPLSEINTFCSNNTSAYVKSDRFRRTSNTDTPVAAVNYNNLFKVNLYPNPASNQFTLTTECSLSDITAIDIYDIAGKIIKRVAARQYIPAGLHAQTINVSTMPNGMYYLKITGQKNGNLLKNIPFIIIKN